MAAPVQFINPPGLCPTFGWTHVVIAAGGKTIYVSGQTSVNERGAVYVRAVLYGFCYLPVAVASHEPRQTQQDNEGQKRTHCVHPFKWGRGIAQVHV